MGRGEHGQLDLHFFARAFRAGCFRLFLNHNALKARFALITDIFVYGHSRSSEDISQRDYSRLRVVQVFGRALKQSAPSNQREDDRYHSFPTATAPGLGASGPAAALLEC